MYEEPTLFGPAPVALSIEAYYAQPHGWTLHIAHRDAGGEWSNGDQRTYDELVAGEMLDVIVAEVHRRLILRTSSWQY